MKNKLSLVLLIIILLLNITVVNAQHTILKLQTADSTSSLTVTKTDNTGLLRLNADGSFYLTGTFGLGIIPLEGVGTRLAWYPGKAAFRAGDVDGTQWDDANVGAYSVALGRNTTASGMHSIALGRGSVAAGGSSVALGYFCNANTSASLAFGYESTVNSDYSTAIGFQTTASGNYSTAIGKGTTASGVRAMALGAGTTASGMNSTAMGCQSQAEGDYSISLGLTSIAGGVGAITIGREDTASADYSMVLGIQSTASAMYAIAMGRRTTASGSYATAMGRGTTASGNHSTAMGYQTTASGIMSTSTGATTTASGDYSTAMGKNVSANSLEGTFIIGDNSTTDITTSSAANEMTARFAGGYRLFTSADISTGVTLTAGGGSWASVSDSTKKENIIPADGEKFLANLSKLKLGSWNYKSQDPAKFRHYGPMAQEIFKYFGKDELGTIGNDTTLASADMDGIMMICLKALELRTRELSNAYKRISTLEKTVDEQNQKIESQQSYMSDIQNEISIIKSALYDITKEQVSKNTHNIVPAMKNN